MASYPYIFLIITSLYVIVMGSSIIHSGWTKLLLVRKWLIKVYGCCSGASLLHRVYLEHFLFHPVCPHKLRGPSGHSRCQPMSFEPLTVLPESTMCLILFIDTIWGLPRPCLVNRVPKGSLGVFRDHNVSFGHTSILPSLSALSLNWFPLIKNIMT